MTTGSTYVSTSIQDINYVLFQTFLMTVEDMSPDSLATVDSAIPGVFGEHSGIFIKVKVKDYLFEGIKMCEGGGKKGGFAVKMICSQMVSKAETAEAMRVLEDSVSFANLRHVCINLNKFVYGFNCLFLEKYHLSGVNDHQIGGGCQRRGWRADYVQQQKVHGRLEST